MRSSFSFLSSFLICIFSFSEAIQRSIIKKSKLREQKYSWIPFLEEETDIIFQCMISVSCVSPNSQRDEDFHRDVSLLFSISFLDFPVESARLRHSRSRYILLFSF